MDEEKLKAIEIELAYLRKSVDKSIETKRVEIHYHYYYDYNSIKIALDNYKNSQ